MTNAQSKPNAPKTNSYDTGAPPNLIQFMLKGWKQKPRLAAKRIQGAPQHQKRREKLSQLFPSDALIIPTGHPKVRANDENYRFRPGSDFFYLTGCMEPDCLLILLPDAGAKTHSAYLFVEPGLGKTDPSFFTDRVRGELWEGPQPTLADFRERFGIENTLPLAELPNTLQKAVSGSYRILRSFSPRLEAALPKAAANQPQKDQELAVALSEMRLIKDAHEVAALQSAIRSTHRAFEDVVRRIPQAKTERELEGVFFTRARMEGNDVGYGTIVASGAHACTLHWRHNTGNLRKGDLLLLDAGVEGHSLYTADITRTLPINGKFTPAQKEIYELVLAAQRAALKAVKPGNHFMDPHQRAMEVLAHGLEKLGILPMPAAEALKEENLFYRRYSLHNVSHMLGLDVHDCAQARAQNYKYGKLQAGMVLTIEPGLYFQPDDTTVPAKYRGIGVRIEDDVVVTAKGCRNLSAGIPTGVQEIQRWMRGLFRSQSRSR